MYLLRHELERSAVHMSGNVDNSYRSKLAAFRTSCRVYQKEKQEMDHLVNRYPSLAGVKPEKGTVKLDPHMDTGLGNIELYQLLAQDIHYVDDVFQRIDEKCGHTAYLMLWMLFIEGRTQQSVAESFGLTRRQMQYSMDKWMKQVLYDE